MIVGCYSLDLYCETKHLDACRALGNDAGGMREYVLSSPGQYTGPTGADCKRQARKAGWLFKRDGRVFCPVCVKDGRAKIRTTSTGGSNG